MRELSLGAEAEIRRSLKSKCTLRRTRASGSHKPVSLHVIGEVLNHRDLKTTLGYAYFETHLKRTSESAALRLETPGGSESSSGAEGESGKSGSGQGKGGGQSGSGAGQAVAVDTAAALYRTRRPRYSGRQRRRRGSASVARSGAAETDPELREKLWQEYRNYKKAGVELRLGAVS